PSRLAIALLLPVHWRAASPPPRRRSPNHGSRPQAQPPPVVAARALAPPGPPPIPLPPHRHSWRVPRQSTDGALPPLPAVASTQQAGPSRAAIPPAPKGSTDVQKPRVPLGSLIYSTPSRP